MHVLLLVRLRRPCPLLLLTVLHWLIWALCVAELICNWRIWLALLVVKCCCCAFLGQWVGLAIVDVRMQSVYFVFVFSLGCLFFLFVAPLLYPTNNFWCNRRDYPTCFGFFRQTYKWENLCQNGTENKMINNPFFYLLLLILNSISIQLQWNFVYLPITNTLFTRVFAVSQCQGLFPIAIPILITTTFIVASSVLFNPNLDCFCYLIVLELYL